jgi:tetratricopeptide (TPR) repeat protein
MFRSKGKLDRAVEDYSPAIRLKPDFYLAINNRGVAFMSQGEFDLANDDFTRPIALEPDFPQSGRLSDH